MNVMPSYNIYMGKPPGWGDWLLAGMGIVLLALVMMISGCSTTKKSKSTTKTTIDSSSKTTFDGVITTVTQETAKDSVKANPGDWSGLYDPYIGQQTIDADGYEITFTPQSCIPDSPSTSGAAPGAKSLGTTGKVKVDIKGKDMKVPVNIDRTTTTTQAGTITSEKSAASTTVATTSGKEKKMDIGAILKTGGLCLVIGLILYLIIWFCKNIALRKI